jgi:mannonate dehydratase
MQVADIIIPITEDRLQYARQLGVTDIVTRPEYRMEDQHYNYEELVQLRTRVEAAGLRVAAIHDVPNEWNDRIRLGLAGREEQLDHYCQTLENMGRAGILILGYAFHADRVWRSTRHAPARGGAGCTGYDHGLMADAPSRSGRAVSDGERWEHFAVFVSRVIPVAEAAGVKMALHPDDPPISPIAGMAYIFRDVAAFQRALDMAPSPSNGLLFCQGCFTEMLGQDVFRAIRHFGGQGKVFYVHYRNVRGAVPRFREAIIDEGEIDMWEAMKAWKEVGFDGPMMPDHYPTLLGDSDYQHRARAHAIGYMKAMMTAAGAL